MILEIPQNSRVITNCNIGIDLIAGYLTPIKALGGTSVFKTGFC